VRDQLDLVRQLFRAINDEDVATLEALYDVHCIVEHAFLDQDDVVLGREAVCGRWAQEFGRLAGALPGGHRVEVQRVAGIETGWGWVRAEWRAAVRPVAGGADRHLTGHSHFWIEDGGIRRHRSVMQTADPPGAAGPAASRETSPRSGRNYPDRPIVGVGGVIVTADRRVVLVKRRYEPLAGQWSLPGGALELGETLDAGTAREIVEETGLVVDVGPVVEVFDRILVDEAGGVRYHFVLIDSLCRPRGGRLTPVAGSDVSDVTLADPDDLARFRLTEKVGDIIRRALAWTGRAD
jgi:ADP-ribose pyrophosphatase YjhB (NUDIX family)